MLKPGFTDRVDPLPGGVEFITPHEQHQVAFDHIRQQTLIGVELAFAKRLTEVETQVDGFEAHPCTGTFGEHTERNALLGLQLDDQTIERMCIIWTLVDRNRHVFEGDDDFGNALLQAFARTQIERHAGPAP